PGALNPDVPGELERICLKCIEKLMSNRYQKTVELLDDLKNFEEGWTKRGESEPELLTTGTLPTSAISNLKADSTAGGSTHTTMDSKTIRNPVRIVPKGLRSFDGQDADFFVDLLPGPKDRFGIPETLRFWLSRLAKDAEDPLGVGLIFGPSGCGKSSFVKAGLIPHLNNVRVVYIEAGPETTESQIFEKLQSVAPQVVRDELELDRIFARIRRGQLLLGEKLLIVVDQFEQWLHANPDLSNRPLIQALRQCDGDNLSCVLLVRDDFWMSATDFMAQLDLKVQDGVNALGIPLFDRRHARRVLTAYGQANEALGQTITDKQAEFVRDAVNEISNNGKVTPIHLALFSQMMDSDSWDSQRLNQVGGWRGLGVQFLRSIFAEKRTAIFEDCSRQILKELLPKAGTKIKGIQKSYDQLLLVADHKGDNKVQETLDFLDRQARIITPTESEQDSGTKQYQLAHDYLVSPVREWINLKERETRQGRARLRLAELTDQWTANQETRFLPSPFEYAQIRTSLKPSLLTDEEQKLVSVADGFYLTRTIIVSLLLAGLVWIGNAINTNAERKRARQGFDALLEGHPNEVAARLEILDQFAPAELVQVASASNPDDVRGQLHCLFAKIRYDNFNLEKTNQVLDLVPVAEAAEANNFIAILDQASAENFDLGSTLTQKFESAESPYIKARFAILAGYLGFYDLLERSLAYTEDLKQRAIVVTLHEDWHGDGTKLLDLVRNCPKDASSDLLSGICQIVGFSFDAEFLTDTDKEELLEELKHLVMNSKSDVHSSARWAIENSGGYELDLAQLTDRNDQKEWYVRSVERKNNRPPVFLTFVKIPSHTCFIGRQSDRIYSQRVQVPPEKRVEREFYISAREVSADLFFEFVSDEIPSFDFDRQFANAYADRGEAAISCLYPNIVMHFCNWLSEKHGLEPVYRLKSWNQVENYQSTIKASIRIEGSLVFDSISKTANGYRIPTRFEWESACRGGTSTTFWWGSDPLPRLTRFVNGALETELIPKFWVGNRGTKLPNPFGIFDMAGNASELTFDETIEEGGLQTLETRGGNSTSRRDYFESTYSGGYSLNDWTRQYYAGIRLVVGKPIDPQ
ncbi:MAG: SUMF1/EgtB/PvdO family nonheme iron enzyme, partial [Planctomycetota bacterium]